MNSLVFATKQDRLAQLRKIYEFTPGRTGTVVKCRECGVWFHARHDKVKRVFLCTLELVAHADEHPSF